MGPDCSQREQFHRICGRVFLLLPGPAAYRRPVISDKRWDTLSVMQLGALVAMTLGLAIGLSSLLGPLLGSRLKLRK